MAKAHRKKDHSISLDSSAGNTGNTSHRFPDRFLQHKYDCAALLDPDLNFVAVNDAYARAHGQPEAFFPGKNHLALYPSDARQIFESVRESKEPYRVSAHPVTSAGQAERDVSYWDWTVEPVLDQNNEVEALILAETDVTRRVRTEQAFYKSSKILTAIERALERHNPHDEPGDILATLLADVIDLTESEYGFIGKVTRNADGRPSLEIGTILNFTHGSGTSAPPVVREPWLVDLTGTDTLPGRVITAGEAVITNDPASEPGVSGLPEGHPDLKTFMGIPLQTDEAIAGVIGLANCADGYDRSLVDFLQPLLKCYLRLIDSNVTYRERHEALTSLAESEYLIRGLAVPATEEGHSDLINLINECYEEMQEDVDTAAVEQLLNKTYSAVSDHFLSEELIMQSTAYPAYEAHKKNHDRFLTTFRSNIDDFVSNPDYDVHNLQQMLVKWFGRHWSTYDLRMNRYFAN